MGEQLFAVSSFSFVSSAQIKSYLLWIEREGFERGGGESWVLHRCLHINFYFSMAILTIAFFVG